jgi:hypothetical protein
MIISQALMMELKGKGCLGHIKYRRGMYQSIKKKLPTQYKAVSGHNEEEIIGSILNSLTLIAYILY